MPTFSEVKITFTTDWIEDDNLIIRYGTIGTPIDYDAVWVVARSTTGEVTIGTPTANAGERTALNLKIAFDLDRSSGFVTAVANDNELTIQSETSGQDFLGVAQDLENTGTATITFSNVVVAATPANVTMALTRSPHYISTPFNFSETTKVTISLYVWDGDLTSVPASTTRVLTKNRPTINFAEFNTNISNIIRESLDETPPYNISNTTQIVNSNTNNVKWVKYNAVYTDTTNTIADIEGTFVSTDGYGYYADGASPSNPSSSVLTDVTTRKVDRTSFVLFPFVNDGTITSIDIDSDGGTINSTLTMAGTNQSTAYIQYISVDLSQTVEGTDEYLTIKVLPAGTEYDYELIDECRYDPKTIVFQNRYGVFETLTMFKKSMETIEVESEEFINNYITAGVYTTTKHQFQKTNIAAKETITLNSGYISDAENELYKQLLLSDNVQIYDSGYIPVNVSTSSLEYKTRVNDSLVKYEIEFNYAYNVLNNV